MTSKLTKTEIEEVYSDLSTSSIVLNKTLKLPSTCCGRGCCFEKAEDQSALTIYLNHS